MAKSSSRRTGAVNTGKPAPSKKSASSKTKPAATTKAKAQPRAATAGGAAKPARQPRTNGAGKSHAAVTPSHADIARRAYDIWIANGRPFGQDEQNWRDAEEQLRAAK